MTEQHDYREISDPAVMAVQPLVSVHMLAYRHERFLAEAIEGVVAQVCDFPIELIIAEDCSPDGTLAIALDYQHRYPHLIRIITGDRNVGMHANATRSVPAARGKYIALCEGDDYWHHPDKIQMQIDMMRADPKTTLCHSDYDRLIGRRLVKSRHRESHDPYLAVGNAFHKLLHHLTVMTATAVYRGDILQAFRTSQFANKNWPFGDYTLALFASLYGPIAYLDESTATWRKARGSAMNSGAQAHLNARIATLDCREAFMRQYPVADHVRREALCFANRNIMNAALYACRKQEFRDARNRMIELGCKLPILDDFLRRTAMRFLFIAKAYQIFRSIRLRMTTEAL